MEPQQTLCIANALLGNGKGRVGGRGGQPSALSRKKFSPKIRLRVFYAMLPDQNLLNFLALLNHTWVSGLFEQDVLCF